MSNNYLGFITSSGREVRLPKASYAKSQGIPREKAKKMLWVYKELMKFSDVSKHKKKQFKLERARYHRLYRKQDTKIKAIEESTSSSWCFLS